MADVEIRPPRPEEYAAAGEVTVEAYGQDGHLAADPGYDAELRDIARRMELAEVLVAVDDTGNVLGTVTRFPSPVSLSSGCSQSRRLPVAEASVKR